MDITNHKIILKELALLCNNCNSLEDNILEIGTLCFPENNYNKDSIEINQKNTVENYVKNIKVVNSKVAKILTYSNILLAKFKKYKIGNRDIDFKTLTKNANANAKVRMRRKTDSVVILKNLDVDSKNHQSPVIPDSSSIPNRVENRKSISHKDINGEISGDKNKDSKEISKDKENQKSKSKENKSNSNSSLKSPPIHPLVKGILSSCKPRAPASGTKSSHSRKPSIVDKNIKNNKDAKTLNDRLSRIKEKSYSTNSVIDDTQKFIEDLKKKLKETTLNSESNSPKDDNEEDEDKKIVSEVENENENESENEKIKEKKISKSLSMNNSPTKPQSNVKITSQSTKKPSSIQTNVKISSQSTKKSPNTPTSAKVSSQSMRKTSNTPAQTKMLSQSLKRSLNLSSSRRVASCSVRKISTTSTRKTSNAPINVKGSSQPLRRSSNSPTKMNKKMSISSPTRSTTTPLKKEKKSIVEEGEKIMNVNANDIANNEQLSKMNEEINIVNSYINDDSTSVLDEKFNMEKSNSKTNEETNIEESSLITDEEIVNEDIHKNIKVEIINVNEHYDEDTTGG